MRRGAPRLQHGGLSSYDFGGRPTVTFPPPSTPAHASLAAAGAEARCLAVTSVTAPEEDGAVGAAVLTLYDLETALPTQALRAPRAQPVLQLAFVATGATLAVLTADSTLTLAAVPAGAVQATLSLRAPATTITLDRSGHYAASVASDGALSIYDLASARAAAAAAPVSLQRVATVDADEELVATLKPEVHTHGAAAAPPRPPLRLPGLSAAHGGGEAFGRRRLRALLNARGEYPHRHRLLIWEFLLQLPAAEGAWAALQARGSHACADAMMRQCVPAC